MPYLFDTYAFIAYYFEGRESYRKYFEKFTGEDYTSMLSLMEVYSRIFHAEDAGIAEEVLGNILGNFKILPLNDIGVIKEAGVFRSKMRKEKRSLSYTDCVNYVLAQGLGIRMLTGDEDFRGVVGVEFVK
ncbi:MAG: PIN domain-containing protein [Candidatus Altiarchaeota archaeon]